MLTYAGADEYQAAVFNCYIVRRVQMHAEASRAAALIEALSALLRHLRHLAAGTQFTCFTSTKVQILTQPALQRRFLRAILRRRRSRRLCSLMRLARLLPSSRLVRDQ